MHGSYVLLPSGPAAAESGAAGTVIFPVIEIQNGFVYLGCMGTHAHGDT